MIVNCSPFIGWKYPKGMWMICLPIRFRNEGSIRSYPPSSGQGELQRDGKGILGFIPLILQDSMKGI